MSVIEHGIETGTWASDPVHSSIGFAVRHLGIATFRGDFKTYEAELDTTGDEPRFTGRVQVASIAVDDENLAAHLQAPDFFDVERHPELTFVSTSFRREGDILEVEGDLTVKGVTKRVVTKGEITETTEDAYGNERVGVSLSTKIDRTEYGLDWNADLPKGGKVLANDVTLVVDLSLVKR